MTRKQQIILRWSGQLEGKPEKAQPTASHMEKGVLKKQPSVSTAADRFQGWELSLGFSNVESGGGW